MSGGSLNYLYRRVEQEIDSIEETSLAHKLFKKHLAKVAQALHDIEWVQSGDMSQGDDIPAIKACIITRKDLLEGQLAALKQEIDNAKEVLEELKKEKK